MARNTLDTIWERKFIDGKVRKALHDLLTNPPKKLLFLLKKAIGDDTLTFAQLKASLERMKETVFLPGTGAVPMPLPVTGSTKPDLAAVTKTPPHKKTVIGKTSYDEKYHLQGKPPQLVDLYRQLDAFCLSLHPNIQRSYLKLYIGYKYIHTFCCLRIQSPSLKVWLRLKYEEISNPPSFAKDVSRIGHWGLGDTELKIHSEADIPEAQRLIRLAFEKAQKNA